MLHRTLEEKQPVIRFTFSVGDCLLMIYNNKRNFIFKNYFISDDDGRSKPLLAGSSF